MTKRNSLIELYRFFFSLIVIKSHGMFPYTGRFFPTGRVSVEFFFVLSGFLLVRTLTRYNDRPYLRGVMEFTISKLRPIAIPTVIALVFNVVYKILTENYALYIWGYLWYVHAMIVTFIFYYTVRYFMKDERKFIAVIAAVFTVSAIVHVIPFMFSNGYARAGMSISLGMLLSYVPRLKVKHRALIWAMLIPVQIATLAIVMTIGDSLLIEEILDLVLYPALIYLTFQIECNNKVFNYLGALSFGLYAFQAVPRAMREMGLSSIPVMFVIIVVLTLIEDLCKRIRVYKRGRSVAKTEDTVKI
jgi:peptidoglycan/LPS O-acetylase OafA/YrhL